ncbi:hybrid sensor histidine kinase/response regulator [Pseudomonas sp. Choline-3u-10]|jgi:PAS domain S-box-containing protein|uniref:CHASE domain-containing protein n=1 Tax=Pseudomonadaceae TaxID=135621 RepID=UPI000617DC7D|nr:MULTISPECIES: CHASE domain-containing protein [Pseudomonadaceae]MAL36944.1 hybrid sensor histidine kinase/response regulator [Pseudomonas sp.]MBU0947761.1 CHASE domain-containing protein [Gammaproteobacteria bacterium]KJJ63261.1 histidine kinase [Pseudomonas sp. 10B238]MBK3796312.1 response regulator [Stutzerimonas stutzeri]MBK3876815.1 response regulator [Stutzerimonas stutzeri]
MDDRSALHSRKPWLPLVVTLALMVGLGGWVGWQWHVQEMRVRAEQAQRFNLAVNDVESTLRERMRAYEMVLRGLAGLFVGSDAVSLQDWNRASDQLQLQDFYPGIQAIALARYARAENLSVLLAKIREGGRDFRIYPRGERSEYLIVDYIHPLDWRNRRVLGFDMLSEETRKQAVMAARNIGTPMLTGPLRLKQETEQNAQVGILLYLPLYRAGAPITTLEERQEAFAGTLHGAFRLTDLMEGVLGSRSKLFQLQLFDAAAPDEPLLVGRAPVSSDASFHRTRNIYMYGRSWQLEVASTPEYEAILNRVGRAFNLAAALTAAVLFSLLIGGYLYLRERALRNSQTLGAQLQEREAWFRQLIEQLPVATVLCSDKGRIELANQSAATLLGSSAGLLAGERLSRYVPGALDETVSGPQLEADQRESQALREDGSPVPVSLSLTSFKRDKSVHHLLNLVDLQQRKRDEERFRNVVEASPNAFVLFDHDGRIVMVNRQTELLFGYNRQELLDQPVEMLIPESMRKTYLEVRHRFGQSPESRRLGENRELFGRHRDGHLVPVEVGLSPLRSGDEHLVQAVVTDIAHRKAAERRLRDQANELMVANRYKSEFLANMSHELRTPLNSILILSDQLRQNAASNLTEKQVRHADIIHRAGHDLLQLINDVLDLAKIEAGHMQIKSEPLDLGELLAELVANLEPMAAQNGLTLKARIDEGVPASLVSDRARLQQILRNLITNALKFTEHGSVDIHVSSQQAESAVDTEMLQICVTDTGIGIAEDQHERIFQAFQQIDGSISRQYGGTGLGLAIARQLAEVLGGGIRLKSAPGQGSSFTVELPLKVAATPEIRTLRPLQRRGQGGGLLIVEDDADFASVVAEVAQSHGFSSVICGTGQEGLDALAQDDFAAVILDVLLPDISGWQVHRVLRADPRHQDTPVYIISCVPQPQGWSDDGSRYLIKPVAQSELERLFVDLSQQEGNSTRLLLVETEPDRRRQLREHFERLGYRVSECQRSEEARLAYAEHSYAVLFVDFDLPGEDGLDLLDALDRLRPLKDVRVILTSREALSEKNLQRLKRYSSVALSKTEGMEHMEDALKPDGVVAAAWAREELEHPLLGQRVLLVDSDVRAIYAISAMLDEQGLQVVPVTTSSEALERFDQDAFDLALVDLSMPDNGGPELIRQLRNDYGCQVPIVAMAVGTDTAVSEQKLPAGADDILFKPVDGTRLAKLLRRLERSDGPHASP